MPHAYYEILVRLSEAPRPGDADERAGRPAPAPPAAGSPTPSPGWRNAAGYAASACPTDRRGQFAALTDDGFAALEAAAPGHVEGVRRHLFDPLSDDQVAQLGSISATLARHLEAGREGAARRARGTA